MVTHEKFRKKLKAYGPRYLYHFTDVQNLPSIKQARALYSWEQLETLKIVAPRPGGDDLSRRLDKQCDMHKYVHLCFKPKHPMEHVAVEAKRIGPTKFLWVDIDVIFREGVLYCDRVSNADGARYKPVQDAADDIDWPRLYTETHWDDPVFQDRRRAAEKAEILIPGSIEATLIKNL